MTIPPLRDRREEIPWLVERERARATQARELHVLLVEACLVRDWPGNVRELLSEVRAAVTEATLAGDERVRAEHLHLPSTPAAEAPADEIKPRKGAPERTVIEDALRGAGGNVCQAARVLGVHRTQLRRWIARYAIDASTHNDSEPET